MFNNIQQQIQERLNTPQTPNKPVASIVMSAPGTEKVYISTPSIELMKCDAAGDVHKERCCIVHKQMPVKYKGQFVNSAGHPTSIVTRVVFDDILHVLDNSARRIKELERENEALRNERDAYKMSIDALRKNGVID